MLFGGHSSKKHHGGAGYLARPRLGTIRGIYSSKPLSTRSPAYLSGATVGAGKKMKFKKSPFTSSKMDSYKKRSDPVDTAYREAVGRLKILLAESYTVPIVSKRPLREDSGDDTDNQSLLSSRSRHSHHHYHRTSPFISRRYPFYNNAIHSVPTGKYDKNHRHDYKPPHETDKKDTTEKYNDKPNPEMVSFIQRQEDYIEQLEREAQFCRDELSGLLGKVKEVLSENENLHEKQKSDLMKSVFENIETETETETENEHKIQKKSPRKSRRLEGPSIVFESRISELEAQLTQTKIELRKYQEENENYKRKIADGSIGDLGAFDSYKVQVDNLQREKINLQEQLTKLQYELTQLKDRNNDTSHKIKRSLDVVEQAQFEKTQLEAEIRRLKDELDRQHDKMRETIHEQGRRIADERVSVERRYTQQIEQLTAELGVQWETTSKLQLELDKQRREDTDVKREVAQKQAHIDELRKEMHTKTATLQSDLAASSAERGSLEQQIASLHLAVERSERQGKQEANRLQAEVQSLRQRLDRADADLLHSRRENLRLSEQVAGLEKEINMNALLTEEKPMKLSNTGRLSSEALPLPAPSQERDKELSSVIKDMEAKHVATVSELEGMIHSQNQLMEKLTSECHLLTQKLEDTSNRHKTEIRELQTNIDHLSNKFNEQQPSLVPSPVKGEYRTQDNAPRNPLQKRGSITPTSRQRMSPTPSHIDEDRFSSVAKHQSPNHNNKNLSRTNSNASIKNNSPTPPAPSTIKRKSLVSNVEPLEMQSEYMGQDHLETQPQEEVYQPTANQYSAENQEQYPEDGQTYIEDQQNYPVDPQQEYDNSQYQDNYDPNEYPVEQEQYTTEDNLPYQPEQEYIGNEEQYQSEQQPINNDEIDNQNQYDQQDVAYKDENNEPYAMDQEYPPEQYEAQDYAMEQEYTNQKEIAPQYENNQMQDDGRTHEN